MSSHESQITEHTQSVCTKWLSKIGVTFDADGNVIYKDHIHIISSKLDRLIKYGDEQRIQEAESSMGEYFNNYTTLAKWLTIPPHSSSSLVQILLKNARFQKCTISYLCQFLSNTEFETPTEKLVKISRQIIENMKCLPHIVDTNFLVSSLFDTISSAHESLKPMIILDLPYILDCTPIVVEQLLKILNQSPNLTQHILSAFENLDLKTEQKEQIRNKVLSDILPSVSTKDLPVVIKFLLNTTDKNNVDNTIEAFRTHIIVIQNNRPDDVFTSSDSNVFYIIQLKNALQFNSIFADAYIHVLEKAENIEILDIWVIYCLFSIHRLRKKSQDLISKNLIDVLSPDLVKESIVGHIKSIGMLLSSMTDLINWCLENSETKTNMMGAAMAEALFSEAETPDIQQNIIASLLTQINIGADQNKIKAAKILNDICQNEQDKLSIHQELIIGTLTSMALSLDNSIINIFKIIVKIAVNLVFRSEAELLNSGSPLHILFSKLSSSTKNANLKAGIICQAALINHFSDFKITNYEPMKKQFDITISSIGNDPMSLRLFYDELYQNKNRGKELNKIIFEKLKNCMSAIFIERADDDLSWFSLDQTELEVNIRSSVIQNDSHLAHTQSLNTQRDSRNNMIVLFTQSGIKLYLDCILSLKKKLFKECKDLFMMPIRGFVRTAEDVIDNSQKITILLYTHSWLVELVNSFSIEATQRTYDFIRNRINHRIEIEDLLINMLGIDKNYVHPIFGPMFPRYANFLKKFDSSFDFVEKYRKYFNAPSIEFIKFILKIPLPLTDETKQIALRIISDYIYLLNPPKKEFFTYNQCSDPPLEIVCFLKNKMLPSVMNKEDQTLQLISERIIDAFSIQISLPVYKEKENYQKLLNTLCKNTDKNKLFADFIAFVDGTTSLHLQFKIMLLCCSILHSGPKTKNNLASDEYEQLCNLCKKLLQSSTPVLNDKDVKKVLPILFEHDVDVLNDVEDLVKNVMKRDILSGHTNPVWSSLTKDSFKYYFRQCFHQLVQKFNEVHKNLSRKQKLVIDDNMIAILMERLVLLSSLVQRLLDTTVNINLQEPILKIIVIEAAYWFENATSSFFDFLFVEVMNNERALLDKFIENMQGIKDKCQICLDHISRNNLSLMNKPKFARALDSWTHGLKAFYARQADNTIRISRVREHDLMGDIIAGSQRSGSSQSSFA